jgi:cephalosporin hydroxylase
MQGSLIRSTWKRAKVWNKTKPMILKNSELDLLSESVANLLADDCAPEALRMLQAKEKLCGDNRYRILLCRVYAQLGRFEMCRDLASKVLEADPVNTEAQIFISMVASATEAPDQRRTDLLERSYASAIPNGFLHRLQDSVHHYKYRGLQFVKSPFDIAIYQLLVWNLKPATIIEIGSKEGGSALWFADLCRTYRLDTQIISIDLFPVTSVCAPQITFLAGNGRDLFPTLSSELLGSLPRPWLIIEDADHTKKTTLAVLEFFHPWLRGGDYIVVEDGIMSDLYPANFPNHTSGPHLALKEFFATEASSYVMDTYYCDFYGPNVTWNTNGYLKRIA